MKWSEFHLSAIIDQDLFYLFGRTCINYPMNNIRQLRERNSFDLTHTNQKSTKASISKKTRFAFSKQIHPTNSLLSFNEQTIIVGSHGRIMTFSKWLKFRRFFFLLRLFLLLYPIALNWMTIGSRFKSQTVSNSLVFYYCESFHNEYLTMINHYTDRAEDLICN